MYVTYKLNAKYEREKPADKLQCITVIRRPDVSNQTQNVCPRNYKTGKGVSDVKLPLGIRIT